MRGDGEGKRSRAGQDKVRVRYPDIGQSLRLCQIGILTLGVAGFRCQVRVLTIPAYGGSMIDPVRSSGFLAGGGQLVKLPRLCRCDT